MINSLNKKENNKNMFNNKLITDIKPLPVWEVMKSFSLTERHFFFKSKSYRAKLCKKIVSQSQLEKYSIRLSNDEVLGYMDIKTYKDCVYIINLDITLNINFEKTVKKFIQVAIDRALQSTTDKKVIINVPSDKNSSKIKKCLSNNGFSCEENQSEYEKNMFGQTFTLRLDKNSIWPRIIKQKPVFVNK